MTHSFPESFGPAAGRRQILGVGAAAAFIALASPSARASAGIAPVIVLPPTEISWVATGPNTHVEVPTVLGARLSIGALPVRSGTRVTISWDARVYAHTQPTVINAAGEHLNVRLVGRVRADRTSGLSTATARLGAELTPGSTYLLALGVRRPLRYPEDIVSNPLPVTVSVGDTGTNVRRTVGTRGSSDGLWGATLGAAWEPITWGEGFHSWIPSLVTVRSTGPAAVPVGTAVQVTLDARVTRSAVARASDGTELAWGSSRRGVLRLTWHLAAPLAAGDRRSIAVEIHPRNPLGSLFGFHPPTVSLRAPRGNTGQRTTGLESLSREDSSVDDHSRRTYGLDMVSAMG